ncbi:protein Flattop [Periophthalmus magnuspinnatus]|uniref:protein Flattop n=1 Tax=Periophthalmus magnuspinnatus TaxID=409849 RepID=UPI0024362F2F|nr:protein Flattop [Periophthalmus magnuspinnatus]
MSSGYSANQYENAFKSQRMQNWCQTKHFKERPSAKQGHTSFIVDDRGHLLPSKKRDSSWSDFKGTWELPSRIPAPSVCPTARSQQGLNRLKAWGFIESLPNMTPTPGGGRHTEGNTDKERRDCTFEQYQANPITTPGMPQKQCRRERGDSNPKTVRYRTTLCC